MNQHAEGSETSAITPAKDAAGVVRMLSTRLRTPLKRFFQKRSIPTDEIDDLVQEVFLRLAGRPGIESVDKLEAYLFTTATNLLRDRHRRQQSHETKAHEPYEEAVHGSQQPAAGPDRALLGAQIIEQLMAALYELPERTRVIFTLYHIEDMPHQQIAQSLGIAVSTIEKHMGRAHAHLIKRLAAL